MSEVLVKSKGKKGGWPAGKPRPEKQGVPRPLVQPNLKETIWTPSGPMLPIDEAFLVKAAAGQIDTTKQIGNAAKASNASMDGIQRASVERIGANKRIMYKLKGAVTDWDGDLISLYGARLVPEQNVVQLLRNGMFLTCPACGGQHTVEIEGQLWLDITPNACPVTPKFQYTECPICPLHNQRKVLWDMDIAPEGTSPDELFVTYRKLDKESVLFGVLTEHIWGKHTQEARIRRWALPTKEREETQQLVAAGG